MTELKWLPYCEKIYVQPLW